LSEAESYATRAGLSGVADDDEEEAEGQQTPSRSYTNASNLIGDSDGDDNNYNSAHLEVDSLADADPAEVEARVLENLGWEEIGQDKELPVIDLERWKSIGPAHQQDGTSENGRLKRRSSARSTDFVNRRAQSHPSITARSGPGAGSI
jgi:hypothetical protein